MTSKPSDQIEAIIFDIGHVLWRDTGFRLAEKWAARCGLSTEAFNKIVYASEWGEQALVGAISGDEKWAHIGAALQLAAGEIAELQADSWNGRWDSELLDYIQTLKPRYKLGVISDASLGTRERVEPWVNEDLFDVIVISAEQRIRKPNPQIYQAALEQLGVQPQNAIFIDDRPQNVLGARAVGMRAMIYTDFALLRPELDRYLGNVPQAQSAGTLVIVPTELEHKLFLEAVAKLGWVGPMGKIGRIETTHYPIPNLTVAQGGLGKTQFAVTTQHLIDSQPNWDRVICAGAAGGLAEGVPVGDIVVATETVEHDIKNNFGEPLMPRFAGDGATITALRAIPHIGFGVQLQFGPVASGDEDVIATERQGELRQRTGALAVAWEGAGGARACQFSDVPYLELRGISDGADADASHDFVANLPMVMGHLALTLRALLFST